MSIRTASQAAAAAARDPRRAEPTPTQPAPLGPPRVLQNSRAPAQLNFFFFKRG